MLLYIIFKFHNLILWKDFHKLGRKSYMFARTYEGAQRAAILYSLLGICKKLEEEPYRWLEDVLTRI
jgi:hypothetical protein